jgi:hypothetical protein
VGEGGAISGLRQHHIIKPCNMQVRFVLASTFVPLCVVYVILLLCNVIFMYSAFILGPVVGCRL